MKDWNKDKITHRAVDNSYVVFINKLPYHVPNEGEWADLWAQVDEYAKAHPEVVMEEYPHVPTLEELVERAYRDFDSRVEARLDAFAATRRYNSIYTAKAAKDSHIAKYAAEGQYCELMWGETYAKCDQLLAEYMPDVLAGKRPIPAWEEIEAQLPPLVWPDEQNKDGGQINE